jgi:hypothetical protein
MLQPFRSASQAAPGVDGGMQPPNRPGPRNGEDARGDTQPSLQLAEQLRRSLAKNLIDAETALYHLVAMYDAVKEDMPDNTARKVDEILARVQHIGEAVQDVRAPMDEWFDFSERLIAGLGGQFR